MQYGAHLPLIAFDGERTDARRAARLRAAGGAPRATAFLCANDHLLFGRPWLDGPTALAATHRRRGRHDDRHHRLPARDPRRAVRPPRCSPRSTSSPTAGSSPGRAGIVGSATTTPSAFPSRSAGSASTRRSAPFARCSTGARRALRNVYSTEGVVLEPRPISPHGPPAVDRQLGLARRPATRRAPRRRLARVRATTRHRRAFRERLAALAERLRAAGKSPEAFPNAIATMWLYVTEKPTRGGRASSTTCSLRPRPPGRRAARALRFRSGPPSSAPSDSAAFARRRRRASLPVAARRRAPPARALPRARRAARAGERCRTVRGVTRAADHDRDRRGRRAALRRGDRRARRPRGPPHRRVGRVHGLVGRRAV